jgi:hypothetical protein
MSTRPSDTDDPIDPAAAELSRRDDLNVAAEFLALYAMVVFALVVIGWSVHRVGVL